MADDKNSGTLSAVFATLHATPLPEADADDRVDELRAELTLLDANVAGWVSRLLAGDESARASLRPDLGLRHRIQALTGDPDENVRRDAGALLDYLVLLEKAIGVAQGAA